MNSCIRCGRAMRLGAYRIKINGRSGQCGGCAARKHPSTSNIYKTNCFARTLRLTSALLPLEPEEP